VSLLQSISGKRGRFQVDLKLATCIVMVTAQNCKFEKDDAY
jgi:hypothetical protein